MRKQPTLFQTVYRLTVVSGVLVCGSMVAYRYGPPPEQLADMIDGAAAMIDKQFAEEGESARGDGSDLLVTEDQGLEPVAENEPPLRAWDSELEPASFSQPFTPQPKSKASGPVAQLASAPSSHLGDELERQRLVAPLLAAGALKADVEPWGQTQKLFRATATQPVGERSSGMMRQLDAVDGTPEGAVARVLAQMER